MASFRAAPLRKPGVGIALLTSEAIAARLEDAERKMERLRALYESFFLGVERRPPHVPRQELNRLMLETQQLAIRNAALRFRFQTLAQRWTLLTTYWNRTLREIESGTYRRDLQKAYRRLAARGQPLTEDEAATLGIPLSRAKAFVAQQNRRWSSDTSDANANANASAAAVVDVPATPPPPPPAPVLPPPDEGADLTALHRAYAEAHGRLALAGPPPTVEQIRAKVLPHLERMRTAHPSRRLDLTVATKDGRVVIRAKPTS